VELVAVVLVATPVVLAQQERLTPVVVVVVRVLLIQQEQTEVLVLLFLDTQVHSASQSVLDLLEQPQLSGQIK
jgi:hypothetical protein